MLKFRFGSPRLLDLCALSTHARAMEAAMIDRYHIVGKSGAYIGLLEWVLWGVLRERRVLMLFGSEVVDIFDLFAPGKAPTSAKQPCRVAAVRGTGEPGMWLSAAWAGSSQGQVASQPRVSHYVIGVASEPSADAAACVGLAPRPGGCARAAALRAGWRLVRTAEQGDCGIDAMAYFDGLPRNATSWQALRR